MTNHSILTSFFKKPNLNAQEVWWTPFLSEFDFDIKYVKEEYWLVDSLRRRLNCVYEVTYNQLKFVFSN